MLSCPKSIKRIKKCFGTIRLSVWLSAVAAVTLVVGGVVISCIFNTPFFGTEMSKIISTLTFIVIVLISNTIAVSKFAIRAEKRELEIKDLLGKPAELIFSPIEKENKGEFYNRLNKLVEDDASDGDTILVMDYYSEGKKILPNLKNMKKPAKNILLLCYKKLHLKKQI